MTQAINLNHFDIDFKRVFAIALAVSLHIAVIGSLLNQKAPPFLAPPRAQIDELTPQIFDLPKPPPPPPIVETLQPRIIVDKPPPTIAPPAQQLPTAVALSTSPLEFTDTIVAPTIDLPAQITAMDGGDASGEYVDIQYGDKHEAPKYPPRNHEGTVWLRVQVGLTGFPNLVAVHKSSGYGDLDQSALRAVKRWNFVVPQNNGVPYVAWALIPLTFKLNDD
jgi:periplasmic protein TonB